MNNDCLSSIHCSVRRMGFAPIACEFTQQSGVAV
jgi:hypothetical protein